MASGQNEKSANEGLHFGEIIIYDEYSDSFNFEIDLSCKGRPVDLQNSYVFQNLHYTVYADSDDDVPLMKKFIFNSILQLFPKNIILNQYEFILIWDVSLNINQIDQKLMNLFSKNALFDVPIEIHPTIGGYKFATHMLEKHPLFKWTMKMINKSPIFTLEKIACDFVGKELLNKIIEEYGLKEDGYFGKFATDVFISEYLFEKMTFANKILFLYPKIVPDIKEEFLKRVQDLELNHKIIKKLRAYFPCPEDYENKD